MRNTIVISLLILFTTSQVGYYCVYSFKQSQVRDEVKQHLKEMLPETSLQLITVEEHGDDIKWDETNKEFVLHGVLYDVVKIKTVKGKTQLYCLEDNKEEQLLGEFAKAIKSSTDNNKSGKASYKFQQADYYFINSTEKVTALDFNTASHYLFYNTSLLSSIKEVSAPPPRA